MRALAVIVLAAALMPGEAPRTSVAFIVSSKRETKNLSSAELRRIFLGQTSRWRNGHRITLLVRPSNTPEGRLFLDRVVHMSDIDYSQWWIGEVFRGEAASVPRVIESSEAMVKAVAANEDAIGFTGTPANAADVSVLTIDGKTPDDPEYPIAR
jgi:ABC-type phosphate transport system substrate-binding protein